MMADRTREKKNHLKNAQKVKQNNGYSGEKKSMNKIEISTGK